MKKLFSILMLLAVGVMAFTADQSKISSNKHRNMIMLIDNGNEHIASQGSTPACSSRLLSALQCKSTPILVSTSLWKNFIVRRQELVSGALFPETDEYTVITFWKNYIKRINFWFDFFSKQKNSNLIEAKMSVVNQINQEFPVKKLQDSPIANRMKSLLPFYCVSFKDSEWSVYAVGDYFYLLIPNCVFDDYKNAYHLDQLEVVNNPTDISALFFKNSKRPEGKCISAFHSLFKKNSRYTWNIFLGGHGINTDWCGATHRLISNLTVTEFKKLLQFFNDSLSMNAFVYSSCYGAGDQFIHTYCENGVESVYNYTIIVPCLGDTISYTQGCDIQLLYTGLVSQDLEFIPEDNQWGVKLCDPCDWQRFFSSLASDIKKFDSAKQWLELTENIGPRYMNNAPHVRFADSDKFVLMYPDNKSIKISASFVALRKKCNDTITIDGNSTQFMLLDTPVINVPCIFFGNILPKTIISVSPGEATHYFSEVQAESVDLSSFISRFIPFGSPTFNKKILIEMLSCKIDPQSAEGAMLHAGNAKNLTVTKMILHVEKDKFIRISFQNHDGTIYGAHMQCNGNNRYLRGIVALSKAGARAHENCFRKGKEQAILSKCERQKVDALCDAFELLQGE